VHVAAGGRERIDHHPLELLDGLECGHDVRAADVVVLDDQMPARRDDLPQATQHSDTLG